MTDRPFRVLGIQQIAIGGSDKTKFRRRPEQRTANSTSLMFDKQPALAYLP